MFNWIDDMVRPCFECQPMRRSQVEKPQSLRTLRTPGHEVELIVSPLAGMKGAAGYHSSVLVAGEEYFFTWTGISVSSKCISHDGNKDVQRMFIGISEHSGCAMVEFLEEHFKPHTYDLLSKNCNSFTDCALYFLCEQRLWNGFRALEQLGSFADNHFKLMQKMTYGEYMPNPAAQDFVLGDVIAKIASKRPGSIEIVHDQQSFLFSTHLFGTACVQDARAQSESFHPIANTCEWDPL